MKDSNVNFIVPIHNLFCHKPVKVFEANEERKNGNNYICLLILATVVTRELHSGL
jgi:hypothetical protein